MTAGQGGARGAGSAGEYDGMDALMAAITGEQVPEEARRDRAFLAEHRAAEADVAVLKEQLARIAEALTGETAMAEVAMAEVAMEEAETEDGPRPVPRPRRVARPARPGRRPPRPGRSSGPRRAVRIALGALAGAAACALVLGFGWLVTHSGAQQNDSARAADKAVREPPARVSGDGGAPADPALDLACSRLVVEGTVAGVEPQRPSPWSKITLTVIRSYKPAHGPAEVGFLLDGGAHPAPRKGQHVLVRVGLGQRNASLWAVGDTRVAVDRAWITEALPESRHTACPSDGSS
ncbi:hypothetical protein AB0L75_41685 [Streptomyces sp. NPDC052101]|uniref:hypothetical protein n=1 Tax=Streptomyces sp. NPDC052101 TaxID=3155763 RepID=UPI00342AE8C0